MNPDEFDIPPIQPDPDDDIPLSQLEVWIQERDRDLEMLWWLGRDGRFPCPN